jgi:hypothetical protein
MDKGLSHHMLQMLHLLHLLQQLQSFPLNGRRHRREKPLSACFCGAGSSAMTTEMRQMQRMARLVPPLCNKGALLLNLLVMFGDDGLTASSIGHSPKIDW